MYFLRVISTVVLSEMKPFAKFLKSGCKHYEIFIIFKTKKNVIFDMIFFVSF